MRRLVRVGLLLLLACIGTVQAQQKQDTIVVARDGTGEYRTIQEAVEAVRAFMDYTVTIYIKDGIYKEKLVIPSWVKNVQLVGESRSVAAVGLYRNGTSTAETRYDCSGA